MRPIARCPRLARLAFLALPALLALLGTGAPFVAAQPVSIEGERPDRQEGSTGEDHKRAASGGEVLGQEFGADPGDFAEYGFELAKKVAPARIAVRYARGLPGRGRLTVSLDGRAVGRIGYEATGGWGDTREELRWGSLDLDSVEAGTHVLRLTVESSPSEEDLPVPEIPPSPVLDLVGRRRDRSSVGHGRNLAIYTGRSSRFFFATHELGDVFSAVDGGTVAWYPDQVIVSRQADGASATNVNVDRIVVSQSPGGPEPVKPAAPFRATGALEVRQVCVTRDDVVVSRVHLRNPGDAPLVHRVETTGDCRRSRAWRGEPGGDKLSRRVGDVMVLVDKNVYPDITGGLRMVIGSDRPPKQLSTAAAGTYFMIHEIELAPGAEETLTLACAIHPDLGVAQERLHETLRLENPLDENRRDWTRFLESEVPRFTSSDRGLDELYAFRWFLLRFSTTGGGLGHFVHPVVLEGRQAYQTFCCYSVPFLAFDLTWASSSHWGWGHIASLVEAAYEDGRLPWYTSPETNRVPIHHRSGTGLSLLPYAAWRHHLVHGNRAQLDEIYEGLRRSVDWWVSDRDGDGDGIFVIDHQLETGMDDLLRWPEPTLRYEAVDATSYALLNLRAVASMAAALGRSEEAARYDRLARRSADALHGAMWDGASSSWRDRHPESGELSRTVCVTTFYPWLTEAGRSDRLDVLRKHLFSPDEFWLPHPVPALPRNHPDFHPTGFWRGPSWPAATSHVVAALARAARESDRTLRPRAAELLLRAARNHLRPRADFYERYNPLTGEPLSTFRDYMHSWWIDLYVRQIAGLVTRPDGTLAIDPLPLGLDRVSMVGIPWCGRRVDIHLRRPGAEADGPEGPGLTVRIDGETVVRDAAYRPDATPPPDPVAVPLGATSGERRS